MKKELQKANEKLHCDGLKLSKFKKHEQVTICFNKVIQIHPNDNTALHHKEIELNSPGEYDEAMEYFEKAIRINRKDKYA